MFGFKKTELSIVMPVFNTKPYLAESLDSVLAATKNIVAEIILVDDGSTDGSLETAEKYAADNKNIRVLRTDHIGPGGARNTGVAEVRGKYLAFVDSDDFVAPDIYENMISVAERDGSEMVVCDVIRKDREKYIHSELHRKAFHNIRSRDIDIRRDRDLIFDGTVYNRIILTSFYKKHRISYPEGVYYEDFPVVQQLYFLADRVSFLRKWGYCWRIRKESITQQQFNRKNIVDRMAMLSHLRNTARECGMPDDYFRALDYKILSLEFNGMISILHAVTEEEAREYVDMAASYIEQNTDPDVTVDLTLYDQQKVSLILDRDHEGLIRLLNYKKANYMNAPVTETEDGYNITLPDDIFTIKSRSMKNEFNNMPYWMSIDSVESSDSAVVIHTHIYIRRVSMPDFSSQDVRAFLINDLSGEEIELKIEKELCPSLTAARGIMVNLDDYRNYYYNYDGTGFSVKIDINGLAGKKGFSGSNYVMLECTNRLGRKNQVLRFATQKAIRNINALSFYKNGKSVAFSTDEIQVFWVTIT